MTTSPLLRFLSLSPVLAVLALAACTPQSQTAGSAPKPQFTFLQPAQIVWKDAGPALPPGAKIAVLEGDPAKPGPFTIRFNFPPNYTIAPHEHPIDEHVTIIAGSIWLATGKTFDKTALRELKAGGFALIPSGTPHYAWTRNGVTLQLHGVGPYLRTYINPADDPRNATK